MATPSLIPAFDDLGPDGFAHLCGALLSSRYPVGSVALGGIAADAGRMRGSTNASSAF